MAYFKIRPGVIGGCAALLVAGLNGGAGTTPVAHAFSGGPAINGTYTATSVGEWAKTNQAFHKRDTTHSTWTITSSCANPQECTGQVTSDEGWTAPMWMNDGLLWYVKRDLPNWMRCPDGSSAAARQTFWFYPAGDDGGKVETSPTLAGKDKTVGVSGACGVNQWQVVEMPFRLDKLS